MEPESLNDLSYRIIECGIEIHRALGPGLLESTYRKCMIYELGQRTLSVVSERIVPVRYKELVLDAGYRLDLIVEDTVIVELKAIESERGMGSHKRTSARQARSRENDLGLQA